MSGRDDPHQRFVNALQQLVEREDRGALAALRRGLGKEPGTVASMYPFVVWNAPSWDSDRYYIVASLFALHIQKAGESQAGVPPIDLGGSLVKLSDILLDKQRDRDKNKRHEGIERRFVAMLNSRADDLPEHLRHMVALLGANHVDIDFTRLLRDLRYWDDDHRRVQRKWARSFWGNAPRTEDAGVEPAASTTE